MNVGNIQVYFVVTKAQYQKVTGVEYGNKEFHPSVIISGLHVYDSLTKETRNAMMVYRASETKPLSLLIGSAGIAEIEASNCDTIFEIIIEHD